ncbi:MAG: YhbY family RNA-binding protein [Oscillospiraceae bacterium]|nr:YhbY family RNA-binding protein [Oscillospiraceae bacterium]
MKINKPKKNDDKPKDLTNSKVRAGLIAQANALPAIYQVGKEGVSDPLFAQVLEGFNTRELMKLKCLLKTLPITVRQAAQEIAAATSSQVVHTVGGSIVLYKFNPKLHERKPKPKAKPIKKGSATKKPSGIRKQIEKRGQRNGD